MRNHSLTWSLMYVHLYAGFRKRCASDHAYHVIVRTPIVNCAICAICLPICLHPRIEPIYNALSGATRPSSAHRHCHPPSGACLDVATCCDGYTCAPRENKTRLSKMAGTAASAESLSVVPPVMLSKIPIIDRPSVCGIAILQS
jgi:hypothetical protein